MEKNIFFETICQGSPVYAGDDLRDQLELFLSPYYFKGGIFILTDLNTEKHCLPVLQRGLSGLAIKSSYSIQPGEGSKNLDVISDIWSWLMNSGATRESLLINLGGGVVSDLGGFAASTFKRGIKYVNIPTSLIGQVDAAIGGKTGVNFQKIKNQIGTIYFPSAVFILPVFLHTLPERHFISGQAEILKTALLSGIKNWNKVKETGVKLAPNLSEVIFDAVCFKCRIVDQDPEDRNIRKSLNFGHTIGHALESFYNGAGASSILHGEAVAAGLICEAFLSHHYCKLTKNELNDISYTLAGIFDFKAIEESHFFDLIQIMNHDKKKRAETINFSLIETIGKYCIDMEISEIEVALSFNYFNRIIQDDQDQQK